MRLPGGKAKPEKVVSKDKTRPVMTNLYLRITGEGDARVGTVEATTSYVAVSLPVELDDHDTEGLFTVDALTAARKLGADLLLRDGEATVAGEGITMPRPAAGQFPAVPALIPTEHEYEIGINAKQLHELAQALGSDTVRLRFVGPHKGIRVDPLQATRGCASRVPDGIGVGVMMPVRMDEGR